MNSYLSSIWELSLKNDKAMSYVRLCTYAIQRQTVAGYTEKHHVLPKCMCMSTDQKNDKENLVVLSAKEHFEAHQLLSEMFNGPPKRKMLYALSGLCFMKNGNRVSDATEYAIVKEASRSAKRGIPLSEEHKQKIKDSFAEFNPNKGRIVSHETKLKQSNAKIGQPRSDETKLKISNTLKGVSKKPFTDEHRKNMGKKKTGKATVPKGTVYEIVTCPHCNKSGGKTGMMSHHFNNCKVRENV